MNGLRDFLELVDRSGTWRLSCTSESVPREKIWSNTHGTWKMTVTGQDVRDGRKFHVIRVVRA